MRIVIESQGPSAIYEQIVSQIKDEIVTGALVANEALPSIRALAAEIGVSVITTKRAYEELEKEGLIYSVPNKGFYVREYSTDYLHEKQLIEIEKKFIEVIELAKRAGLSGDEMKEMLEGLL